MMTIIPLSKDSTLPKIEDQQDNSTEEIVKEISQSVPSQDEINMNHEMRIRDIESALLRIRGAI